MNYYIVDGSEDCFYTAVFDAYADGERYITSEKALQVAIGCKVFEVVSDESKAARVRKKLAEIDPYAERDVTYALRSDDGQKENVAFDYIKAIVSGGRAVRGMKADPVVIAMGEIRYRVTHEIDKLKGFLRFMENAQGILYAPYSPDNDLTDILGAHFARRFKNQRFVIHDLKRGIAALYDGEALVMTRLKSAEIRLSEREKYFESLWRLYYKSVNIEERPHEKQMKRSMPVRYWKFLPEKK